MVIGPISLLVIVVRIFRSGGSLGTLLDLAYVAVLLGVIGARSLESYALDPSTSAEEPPATTDLQHFAMGAAVFGAAVWTYVHILGFIFR
jgi:hypothetical protein